ncbi:toprim domain-containing protein [Streptomyces hydrogenans]|uniref:toprim domain-containing protein n=1 Tax=Streptomyces hydrogenans TaxID=1873719 RepID=UPI0035DC02B4
MEAGFSFTPLTRRELEELEVQTRKDQELLSVETRVLDYLKSRALHEGVIRDFRLGAAVDGGRVFLTIPYLARIGVGMRKLRRVPELVDGKWVQPAGPKYLAPKGAGTPLFNTRALSVDSPILFATEGEVDAITTQGLLGFPAVGVPGGTVWRPSWEFLFAPYTEVVWLGDGDETGAKFAARADGIANARGLVFPDGKDPNSVAVEEGVPGLAEILGVGLE